MAIFGFGKKDQGGEQTAAKPAFELNPEKARSWFKHATVAFESENFEYAVTCWLSGLRFEPNNLESVKSLFTAATRYGKSPSKDMYKAVDGRTDVDRYLSSMMQWACKQGDTDLGMKTLAGAATVGLTNIADYLAPAVVGLALRDPKIRKSGLVELMRVLEKVERFDLATKAGDAAVRLDPSDAALANEVRNLSAQSTMNKGGYENTGEEGGFRSNVKDLDKQRMLDEQERVVKSVSTVERLIDLARAEYEANKTDRPTITKYAKLLLERGTPEDEATATAMLTEAHERTKEYRFRQLAGDIKIRQAKRMMKPLQQAVEANPSDETAKGALAEAQKRLLETEQAEYQSRVNAYPTDLTLKFELGKRYLELGQAEQAIDMFQQSKADGRLKSSSLNLLATAFSAVGFDDEAIETYRQALEAHSDGNDATGMELRYGLCLCLQRRATEMRDLPSAEEAAKLASAIAMQQISFKDVRQRREQLKALIMQLRTGGGASPA